MSHEDVSDDMLMALADHELDETEAHALRALIAAHPNLAARFALFETTRADAQAALAPLTNAPTPRRLVDAIQSFSAEGVTPFRRPASRWRSAAAAPWLMPLAACFTLAIVGWGGFQLGALQDGASSWSAGPPIAQEAFQAALDQAAPDSARAWRVGDTQGEIRAHASFRLADGRFCRSFDIRGATQAAEGLACRENGAWRTEIAMTAPIHADTFAPAGGAEAFEAFLDAQGATRLEPNEETALIARGWRE